MFNINNMFNINYTCLIGLSPFIYSCIYNMNIHSLTILMFGILYHTNKNNKCFRKLDIIQCFLNASIICYLNPESRIYGIITFIMYIINTFYFLSNDYFHIFVQISAWKGLSLYNTTNVTFSLP